MRSTLGALFILIAIVIAGGMDHRRELAEAQAYEPSPSPRTWSVNADCPLEDSCYVEYADGEWYVIEGERD